MDKDIKKEDKKPYDNTKLDETKDKGFKNSINKIKTSFAVAVVLAGAMGGYTPYSRKKDPTSEEIKEELTNLTGYVTSIMKIEAEKAISGYTPPKNIKNLSPLLSPWDQNGPYNFLDKKDNKAADLILNYKHSRLKSSDKEISGLEEKSNDKKMDDIGELVKKIGKSLDKIPNAYLADLPKNIQVIVDKAREYRTRSGIEYCLKSDIGSDEKYRVTKFNKDKFMKTFYSEIPKEME